MTQIAVQSFFWYCSDHALDCFYTCPMIRMFEMEVHCQPISNQDFSPWPDLARAGFAVHGLGRARAFRRARIRNSTQSLRKAPAAVAASRSTNNPRPSPAPLPDRTSAVRARLRECRPPRPPGSRSRQSPRLCYPRQRPRQTRTASGPPSRRRLAGAPANSAATRAESPRPRRPAQTAARPLAVTTTGGAEFRPGADRRRKRPPRRAFRPAAS